MALNLLINPRLFIAGLNAAGQALKTFANVGKEAAKAMDRSWDGMKNTLFSVRSAIVALGVAGVARDMYLPGASIERAERSLRGVTATARDAAAQFSRLQKIGDEFQLLPDEDITNSFRMLAAFGLGVEDNVRSLANVAAQTGNSVSEVTNAVIAGQQRMLRQLGVQLIDLGTGQVDLVFGNIEKRVANSEDEIRKGLLELLKKGFPDATKELGNSMTFQFERIKDRFSDLEQAIMKGGLQTFLTKTFKTIADAFGSDDDVERKGMAIAQGLITVLTAVGRVGAFVLDIITKIYNAMQAVAEIAKKFKMYEEEQKGKNQVSAQIYQPFGIEQTGEHDPRLYGPLMHDFIAGKTREAEMKEHAGIVERTRKAIAADPVGAAVQAAEAGQKSYSESFDAWVKDLNVELKKAIEDFKDAKNRVPKVTGGNKSNKERILTAQIDMLKLDTAEKERQEAEKRDRLYQPERAEAYAQALDYINQKIKAGQPPSEQQEARIIKIFAVLGLARAATRLWTEDLERQDRTMEARNKHLTETADALRDLQDANAVLALPRGVARREEEIRLEMIRKIERDRIEINADVLKQLEEMPKVMALIERATASITAAEQRELDHLEKIAVLRDKAKDRAQGITAGESFETRLSKAQREAERNQVDFDAIKEGARIAKEMDDERADSIEELNKQIETEIDLNLELAHLAGRSRQDREVENELIKERNRLITEGKRLSPSEEMDLRSRLREKQRSKDMVEASDAFNKFVDSMEVGWTQIERSAEQAYSHLEDGLVQFFQTGKMNLTNFVDFFQQEMLRLSLRFLISQGFSSLGGSSGLTALLGNLAGSFKGPGFGAAANTPSTAALGTGAFANQPVQVQEGGVIGRF